MTNLRLWRLKHGLTARELGSLLGIHPATFSLLESGRLRPSRRQLEAFRSAFGSAADSLFETLDNSDSLALKPAMTTGPPKLLTH
mgnify:CR=1 FL=1